MTIMGIHIQCPEDGRPICQMPGCGIEVEEGQKYCEACAYIKEQELLNEGVR